MIHIGRRKNKRSQLIDGKIAPGNMQQIDLILNDFGKLDHFLDIGGSGDHIDSADAVLNRQPVSDLCADRVENFHGKTAAVLEILGTVLIRSFVEDLGE